MQPILLHKDYVDLRFTKNLQKFDPRNCLEPATQFCITLRLNQTIQQDFKVSIDWYKDLLMLSLLLGGLGKRSRKGRGCVELTNSEALALQDRSAAIDWICRTLNKIAQTSTENLPPTIYQRQESIIQSTIALPSVNNRPVIQTIYFGAAMKVSLLNEYLTTVDHYCHKLKDDELSLPGKRDAKLNKAITGEGSPRFASPLIISVIKLNEQFMPVYTAVRAVNGTNTIDLDCSQRTAFINLIENTMKRK